MLKKIAVALFLLLIVGIIVFDLGNFALTSEGAGDIWWTEVESLF